MGVRFILFIGAIVSDTFKQFPICSNYLRCKSPSLSPDITQLNKNLFGSDNETDDGPISKPAIENPDNFFK